MPESFSISKHFPGLHLQDANNFEASRLATFKNFKSDSRVYVTKLAEAGFVYTGVRDRVKCNWCPFTHENWLPEQNPWDFHQSQSPACPLFRQMVTDTIKPNISIPLNSNAKTELLEALRMRAHCSLTGIQESCPDRRGDIGLHPFQFQGVNMRNFQRNTLNRYENIFMRTARSLVHTATHSVSVDKEGKYPQFASEQRRSNTFHGFPLRDEHLLRRLVQIGFFYTGHSDIVICYSCGLSLYQWLQEDDPYIVHARWKPNCQHIRSVLTSAYIDAVQRETATIGSTQ